MNALARLRKEHNLTQARLAKMINVHQTAVSQWEQGRTMPDIQTIAKLSKIFGVTIEELLDSIPRRRNKRIPVLGKVIAGIPIDAVEEVIDYEEIADELAQTGEYFALQIRGDSMEPRIKEGDVVIVRKQSDVESGSIAIVLINGNEATVKKLVKHEDGISLIPFNSAYSPIFYTNSEIASLPVQVIGKVVELRAKF